MSAFLCVYLMKKTDSDVSGCQKLEWGRPKTKAGIAWGYAVGSVN